MGRYKQLERDIVALDKYDERVTTRYANQWEQAKQAFSERQRQLETQFKPRGKKVKPAAVKAAVKIIQNKLAPFKLRVQAAENHYIKQRAPWDNYMRHMQGQAKNNPMWWAPNGNMRSPRQLMAFVSSGLIKGLDAEAEKLWANIAQPIEDYGMNAANVARLPSLVQINGSLVYQPSEDNTVGVVRQTAKRPGVQFSSASALKPGG